MIARLQQMVRSPGYQRCPAVLFCLFTILVLWCPVSNAQEEVRLRAQAQIAPRINIAAQPLTEKTSGTSHPAIGDTISRVFINDLKSSGVFNVIDLSVSIRDSLGQVVPAFLDTNGTPDFELLQKMSAQTLVSGEFEVRNPQIEITLQLVDVNSRRIITTKSYAAFDLTLRRVIHRMADDVVMQMTGESGIAQTRIAFISDRTGSKELYAADYDGFNVQQLTNDSARKYSPNWSPDGTKIAYVSYRDGLHELYALDLQTGETSKILPTITPRLEGWSPRWSPDGRYIAFGLSIEGESKFFLCNADGTGLRPIVISFGIAVAPTWSPNSDQLAYVSDRTDEPHVYVVNVDGSNDQRITFEGKYNASPSWSPRGDRIAFVAGDTLTTKRGLERIFNVYTCDINGENLMRLTGIEGIEGNNEDPAWSPDGLHILISSDRSGRSELYMINWDGTDIRPVVSGGDNITPTWGPRP